MAPNQNDYNKDELEAPEWLNKEFFTKVLKHSENDKCIEVLNIKMSPATFKGDHYASVMFRANLNYRQNGNDKEKSVVLKIMPELEGHKMDMLKESHIFETEIGVYTEVLPKFEEILRAAGDNTVLGPNCIYYSLSPKKIIILEDIVPLGYTTLRNRFPNLEEVKVLYNLIAKWHAVSYKMLKENPKFFDKYRYGIFLLPNFTNEPVVAGALERFTEMLDTQPDLKKFKPYFLSMKDKIITKTVESFKEYRENPQKSACYVLCHGDFHSKNLMFKENSSVVKSEDFLLLDFQLSYIGPIVNDIIYSICMLLSPELRKNNLDELLHYYFTTFQETLKKIGFSGPIPKYLEFRRQRFEHRHFELLIMIAFLPIWYTFVEGTVDVDEMTGSEDYRKNLYQNPLFIEEMRTLLPRYLHLGYFESD